MKVISGKPNGYERYKKFINVLYESGKISEAKRDKLLKDAPRFLNEGILKAGKEKLASLGKDALKNVAGDEETKKIAKDIFGTMMGDIIAGAMKSIDKKELAEMFKDMDKEEMSKLAKEVAKEMGPELAASVRDHAEVIQGEGGGEEDEGKELLEEEEGDEGDETITEAKKTRVLHEGLDSEENKLRVWWVRNPPSDPTYYRVANIEEAKALLTRLANQDLRNKRVTNNAGGLEVYEDGEWSEWYDENGDDIDALLNESQSKRPIRQQRIMTEALEDNEKPDARVIGEDSNVFNILGICSKALKRAGKAEEAKEMSDRVFNANSYNEALNIMQEYVNFVGDDREDLEECNLMEARANKAKTLKGGNTNLKLKKRLREARKAHIAKMKAKGANLNLKYKKLRETNEYIGPKGKSHIVGPMFRTKNISKITGLLEMVAKNGKTNLLENVKTSDLRWYYNTAPESSAKNLVKGVLENRRTLNEKKIQFGFDRNIHPKRMDDPTERKKIIDNWRKKSEHPYKYGEEEIDLFATPQEDLEERKIQFGFGRNIHPKNTDDRNERKNIITNWRKKSEHPYRDDDTEQAIYEPETNLKKETSELSSRKFPRRIIRPIEENEPIQPIEKDVQGDRLSTYLKYRAKKKKNLAEQAAKRAALLEAKKNEVKKK